MTTGACHAARAAARAAVLGVAASTVSASDLLALVPRGRAQHRVRAAGNPVPDRKVHRPRDHQEGVRVRFAPVYTTFATFALARTPTRPTRRRSRGAGQVEASYPFSPSGVFMRSPTASPTSNGSRAGWRGRWSPATCRGSSTNRSATPSKRPCRDRPTSRRRTRKSQAALQHPGSDRVQRLRADPAAATLTADHRRRARRGCRAKARCSPARASVIRARRGC